MAPHDDDLRVRIRSLYFVERQSVRAIAALLSLHPHAVHRALVLVGGAPAPTRPEPSAGVLAAEAGPRPAVSQPRRLRRAPGPRRLAAGRRR